MTVLLLASVWGYFFLIRRFGRVRIWFVPLTGICGMALCVFAGGLLGALREAAGLVLLGGLAGFLVFAGIFTRQRLVLERSVLRSAVRQRPVRREPVRRKSVRWSLAGICLCAGISAFALLTLRLRLLHYDNFSHWALIVKYLLLTDGFPGADTEMIPFRDYPPGVSVWIYYVCRFAGHSQGVMLLAQNSLLFSCFLAVFGIVKEERRFLLYSFLGMGCALLSYLNLTVRINNLLVDFLLPLLAMASAAVSYRCREEPGRLCVLQSLILGFTGIVKGTGLFFAGVSWLFALGMYIRGRAGSAAGGETGEENPGRKSPDKKSPDKKIPDKKIPYQKILYGIPGAVLLTAGMLLPAFAWQYHVRTDLAGFEGKFSAGTAAGKEQGDDESGDQMYGAPVSEEDYPEIIREFLRAAADPGDRAAQAVFLSTLAAGAAVLYARRKRKKRWKLGRILAADAGMLFLYYAGMLYLYLCTMPAEEALRLAGFDRYACSGAALFCGFLIMGAVTDMEASFAVGIDERGPYRAYSSPEAKRRYQFAVLATVVIGVNFLYSEYSGLLSIRAEYGGSLPGRVERIAGDRWYADGREDERSWLVTAPDEEGQVESGEVRYVCRYFLWAQDVTVIASEGRSAEEIREEERAAGREYDCVLDLDAPYILQD